jgi:hypothetical protein
MMISPWYDTEEFNPPPECRKNKTKQSVVSSSSVSPQPHKVLQKSPVNADQIFRPRKGPAQRGGSTLVQNADADKDVATVATTPLLETRQDSSSGTKCIALAGTIKEQEKREDDNHGNEDTENSDMWEPIPLNKIWDDESTQLVIEDANKLPDWLCPPGNSLTSRTIKVDKHYHPGRPRPAFHGPSRYQRKSFMEDSRSHRVHRTYRTIPSTNFPCPVSPVARKEKDHDMRWSIVSPEAETARRLAAADQLDCELQWTNHKRKSYWYMPYENSNKIPRISTRNVSSSPARLLLTTCTHETGLLQRFWEYCSTSRPHLLHTLRDAIKETQTEQSPNDDSNSLVSKVMEKLVQHWGGPLLGEVYRRVLSNGGHNQPPYSS